MDKSMMACFFDSQCTFSFLSLRSCNVWQIWAYDMIVMVNVALAGRGLQNTLFFCTPRSVFMQSQPKLAY